MTPYFARREVADIIGTTRARISYATNTGRYRLFLMREDAVALGKSFRLPVPGEV